MCTGGKKKKKALEGKANIFSVQILLHLNMTFSGDRSIFDKGTDCMQGTHKQGLGISFQAFNKGLVLC